MAEYKHFRLFTLPYFSVQLGIEPVVEFEGQHRVCSLITTQFTSKPNYMHGLCKTSAPSLSCFILYSKISENFPFKTQR